jgi:hypothetical protein
MMMRIQLFFLLFLVQVALMAAAAEAAAPHAFLQIPRGGGWLVDIEDKDTLSKLKSKKDKVLKDTGKALTSAKDDVKSAVASAKKDADSLWSKKYDGATKKYDEMKEKLEAQKNDAAKTLAAERKKLTEKASKQESALQKQIDDLKQKLKEKL